MSLLAKTQLRIPLANEGKVYKWRVFTLWVTLAKYIKVLFSNLFSSNPALSLYKQGVGKVLFRGSWMLKKFFFTSTATIVSPYRYKILIKLLVNSCLYCNEPKHFWNFYYNCYLLLLLLFCIY